MRACVCLCVRPSVTLCFLNILKSHGWILLPASALFLSPILFISPADALSSCSCFSVPVFRCSCSPLFLFLCSCFQMFLFSSVPFFQRFLFPVFLFSTVCIFRCTGFPLFLFSSALILCSFFQMFLFSSILFLCSCFQMFLISIVPVFQFLVSLFLFSDAPVNQCSCFSVPVFRCSCFTVPVSLCFFSRCSCFPLFLFSSVPVFQCSCSSVSAVRLPRPAGLGCVDGTKTVASWSYLLEKTGIVWSIVTFRYALTIRDRTETPGIPRLVP